MYSLPTRVTLAAFTMASAASTDPMSPLVSTSPSASCAMRATLTYAAIARPSEIRYRFATVQQPPRFAPLVDSARVRRRSRVACGGARRSGAAGRDTDRHAEPRPGARRQSAGDHLQVRRRRRREVRPGLSGVRARHRRGRRVHVGRRPRSADADQPVEARADDRVHANDLRAGLSVRRRGDDPDRPALEVRRPPR